MVAKEKNSTVIDDITRALKVLGGAGIRASEKRELYVIPTDIKAINDVVFGCGGIPLGRVIELYAKEMVGKSTFSYWLIGQVQKRGSNAALFDAEGAYLPEYGASCGIDNDRLILPEFAHGEEALDQMKMLIATDSVSLIVADAMPAFQPLLNVDQVIGERVTMNKNLERAKMYTRFFNDMMGGFRIKPPGKNQKWIEDGKGRIFRKLYDTGTCLVFINHSKDKIGVMYGCFHYRAKVMLADGSTEMIGKIVNNKLPVKVLSWSSERGLETKKITNYFENGRAEKFTKYMIDVPQLGGRRGLPIGDDHLVMTPKGEKFISKLKISDEVMCLARTFLNQSQFNIALGTFLGDGSLRKPRKSKLKSEHSKTVRLRIGHGSKQANYCKWKAAKLGRPFMSKVNKDSKGLVSSTSLSTPELFWLKEKGYKKNKALRFVDKELLNKLTIEAIAVWYLDDGHFGGSYEKWGKGKSRIAATKLSSSDLQRLALRFQELGLPKPSVALKPKPGLVFNAEESYLFHKIIASFLPRCMGYKIHPHFRELLQEDEGIESEENSVKEILMPAPIIKIYPNPKDRNTHKFDLEIEGNSNYFVNNVLVHNSKSYTPGGDSINFATALRIGMTHVKKKQKKKGDARELEYKIVKIKAPKNKVAIPFGETSLKLYPNGRFEPLKEEIDNEEHEEFGEEFEEAE